MSTARKKAAGRARTRGSDAKGEVATVRHADETGLLQTPGQKVLVAEDNKVTQDLLKLLLKQRGHEVHIVANGQDALKALEADDYDVVLMDFHLPKLDGVKVATAFRSGETAARPTRFIAITADYGRSARPCRHLRELRQRAAETVRSGACGPGRRRQGGRSLRARRDSLRTDAASRRRGAEKCPCARRQPHSGPETRVSALAR